MRRKYAPVKIPFASHSEIMVAGILNAEPGEFFFRRTFDEAFLENLRESMTNEIEVLEGDHPLEADQKLAMIEVKRHFKELFDAGREEEILKELEDAQDELMDAMTLKRQLEAELREIDETEEDAQAVVDFHEAADRMLRERGLKPIESIYAAKLKRRLERERRRNNTGTTGKEEWK